MFFSIRTKPVSRSESSRLPMYSAQREEGLCDAFAGALLAPRRSVMEMTKGSLSASEILRFAARLRIAPAVLIRWVVYDFGCLADSRVYLIFTSESPKARVFRGVNRRSKDSMPTARMVEELLRGKNGSEAAFALQQYPGFPEADMSTRGSMLCVIV